MSQQRAFIVLNPVAGVNKASAPSDTIARGMRSAGWACTIHETEPSEDVANTVRAAVREGYDLVIAAGGDGTVSATADGLVGSNVPLGIVPTGTGNALAREMGIPLQAAEAVALITGPHSCRPIDALAIDGKHYFLNASIGVSAATMADTERAEKRHLGFIAYVITGIQKLVGLQPAGFELTIDGGSRYVHAADIVVTNGDINGISGLKLVTDSTIDDGKMTVCIVRGKTLFDYASILINAVLLRARDQHLECVPAHHTVEITSTRRLPVQADGEPIGTQSVAVRIVPQAVALIVPEAKD